MPAKQPYLQVLAHVESLIIGGHLSVGDKLESERLLAQRLKVGRSSVREAIRTLAALGLVKSSTGSGPTAGAILISDVEVGVASALRLHLATRSLPIEDLVRTRVMLEAGAYREVDRKVSDRELEPARQLLTVMDSTKDPAAFHATDMAFHLELVKISGNSVATLMLSSLRHAIEGYVMEAIDMLPLWNKVSQRLQVEHRSLVDALAAGDGGRAAQMATDHITSFARQSGLL